MKIETNSDTLIIIPSYVASEKHLAVLDLAVRSAIASCDADILVVDDFSPMQDKVTLLADEYLEEDWWNRFFYITKKENSGFSSTVNKGLKVALRKEQNACLVNADIEFREKGWLEEAKNSDADIVGGLLFYPNYIIQHAGIYFSTLTRMFSHRFAGAPPNLPAAQVPCECPVTGALQFIRKDTLQDVGLYDEGFKMGFEDVDYMIRAIQKGHKSLYNPKVKAVHHESLFRGKKNEKIKSWEHQSLVQLITKYSDTDFSGIAPSIVGE